MEESKGNGQKTYVITSGKGGVGKTTVTASLGVALSLLGFRVALVDGDAGLRNLDAMMGLENHITYDVLDVIEGTCRLSQALVGDWRHEGLYMLAAPRLADSQQITPQQMQELVAQMEASFDYVLVDCPAGIEQGFRNAISGAKGAIVVATPDVASVRDAARAVALLQEEEFHPFLVVNRLRKRMARKGRSMNEEEVAAILDIPLLGVVPEDEHMLQWANQGEPLGKIKAPAARAVMAMAVKLSGRKAGEAAGMAERVKMAQTLDPGDVSDKGLG